MISSRLLSGQNFHATDHFATEHKEPSTLVTSQVGEDLDPPYVRVSSKKDKPWSAANYRRGLPLTRRIAHGGRVAAPRRRREWRTDISQPIQCRTWSGRTM